MIDKGKISALQMAILMSPTIVATAILSAPAITAKLAGHDMWLSPIWASLVGFMAFYISWRLNKLYPSETIIEYSVLIIGRIAGKILGFVYLFFYLHINGIIIRQYGEFVLGSFLTKTPLTMVSASMILICAFAVYGGVEVVGRSAQIMFPVVVLFFMVTVLLLTPDLNPTYILPFMENGIAPSFIGALVPQGWFSEFFAISFLLPFVADRKKVPKWGAVSVISVTFILFIVNVTTFMLFGNITKSLSYPFFTAARYISLADFFEHVESIVMAIWVTGVFIKITVFYYILSIGTAQWLELSDYRPVVFPVGLLLVVFSIWSATNIAELNHYLGTISPFYLTSVQVIVPLLLMFIALLRKKFDKSKGGQIQ